MTKSRPNQCRTFTKTAISEHGPNLTKIDPKSTQILVYFHRDGILEGYVNYTSKMDPNLIKIRYLPVKTPKSRL